MVGPTLVGLDLTKSRTPTAGRRGQQGQLELAGALRRAMDFSTSIHDFASYEESSGSQYQRSWYASHPDDDEGAGF
ncbi:unnamed protein product [Linum trigynum]|uniref:Uncharacterized protein n=1 Tax=Linum trigynum TaxID=586398 RepID=A0AAV2EBG6_9ROSI